MAKKRISTENLTPGMKLAEKITNASGVAVIPSGVRLTPLFINRLAKWGVDSVEIEVEEDKAPETDRAATRSVTAAAVSEKTNASVAMREFAAGVLQEVNARFAHQGDNALMTALKTIALKKLVSDGPAGKLNRLRSGFVGERSMD